ncbi:hypothetical protein [Cohnella hashimotonis]|uniref:Uncharacterized protein n=1 Tax=Cohnella hashimotonis TaxID=2826895 RepID=A0ABT6TBG2_9BACL|nr:hypothetical protein [Cohnella hashimotonis]MDI4644173.1 hypothetical protein [Cohnella hashimotonis]
MNQGQFYCVACNELIGLKEARLLFKSGYYTVIYPLGCCRSCCAKHGLSETGSSSELLKLQKSEDWRTPSSVMIAI